MLTTQSEKFQKFEFKFLAGIWSNTWRAKSREIEATVSLTVPVRLVPVAMLVDVSAAEPSPLCPDPSREKGRRKGRTHPGPPLFFLCSLHVTDRCDLARADPQHLIAETEPRKHARKAAVPGVLVARR
jgi:hypothetical protein